MVETWREKVKCRLRWECGWCDPEIGIKPCACSRALVACACRGEAWDWTKERRPGKGALKAKPGMQSHWPLFEETVIKNQMVA